MFDFLTTKNIDTRTKEEMSRKDSAGIPISSVKKIAVL
jgi:hypothetical protein